MEEKEAGQLVALNQSELGLQPLFCLLTPRRGTWVAAIELGSAEACQLVIGVARARWWLIAKVLRQIKATALGNSARFGNCLGQLVEESRHLGRRLEDVLAIASQRTGTGIECEVMANCHQYVLERTASTQMQVHIIRRNDGELALARESVEAA